MSPSKKSLHVKGLAGGVYQSLYTGDIQSVMLVFSTQPIQYSIQCKGGGGVLGLRQITGTFLDDDILHCLL
jgi:hypothetical protein